MESYCECGHLLIGHVANRACEEDATRCLICTPSQTPSTQRLVESSPDEVDGELFDALAHIDAAEAKLGVAESIASRELLREVGPLQERCAQLASDVRTLWERRRGGGQ